MNKLKAALIHLFLSFLIVSTLFLVVYYIWYPKPFFDISGTIEPLKLLILIDVIIGPLLTFIVYKKNKSTLVLDLSVIALLQIAALLYGGYTIAKGRPVLVVMNNGEFNYLVDEYVDSNKITDREYLPTLFSKPKYANLSKMDSFDIYNSISNLEKLNVEDAGVLSHSLAIDNVIAMFSKKENEIKRLAKLYEAEDILFFKLDNNQAKYYVIYSQKQNRIIDKLKF